MEPTDHDLLTRVDEWVKALQAESAEARKRIKAAEDTIATIRLARALTKGQIAGITMTVGAIGGILFKLFW